MTNCWMLGGWLPFQEQKARGLSISIWSIVSIELPWRPSSAWQLITAQEARPAQGESRHYEVTLGSFGFSGISRASSSSRPSGGAPLTRLVGSISSSMSSASIGNTTRRL